MIGQSRTALKSLGLRVLVCAFVLSLLPCRALAQEVSAPSTVARIWSEEHTYAVGELLAMLGDTDRHVRAYAAMRLGDVEPTEAPINALIGALSDEDEDVRIFAVASLAKLGEPAAPALGRALGPMLVGSFDLRYYSEAMNDVRSVHMGRAELAFAAIALSRYENADALIAAAPSLPPKFGGGPGHARPASDPLERAWKALLAQREVSSALVLRALSAPFDETPPAPGGAWDVMGMGEVRVPETRTQKERVTLAALSAAARVEQPSAELIAALRAATLDPLTRPAAACSLIAQGIEIEGARPSCSRRPDLYDFNAPSFGVAVYRQLPDGFDEAAAARAFDQWTTHTPAAGGAYYMIARALVRARIGRMADLLDAPARMLVSAHEPGLAHFPWPPPPGFRDYVFPAELVARAGPTMGDVASMLTGALRDASGGHYTFGYFSGPEDGYILLARMERINRDGSSLNGRARWLTDRASMSFIDVVSELFFERPGYFRMIAFAVTSDTSIAPGGAARIPEPREGSASLPLAIARQPVGQRRIHAIIYSFERETGGGIKIWTQGTPPAERHMQASGILNALRARSR